MDCDLAQVLRVVAGFVARTRGVSEADVTVLTRLLEAGLIDSFGVAELIAELEEALGTTLPEGALLPQDFESPEVLFERLRQL